MKKLPIGIQTFEQIIEDGYVYVDKTAYIHRLLTEGKAYFLSRPRRFGKSLLVSTLKAVFQGKKELFKGLAIDNLPWDWTPCPVMYLDFSKQQWRSPDEIDACIRFSIEDFARDSGIELSAEAPLNRIFEVALRESARVRTTAILIDEYDKPILDTLTEPDLCRAMKERLKGFYTSIKAADEYLRFVFLTGVSKFAKISVFSGLNNLNDLTMHPDYAAVCGYTDEEVDLHFTDRISKMAEETGRPQVAVREEIRAWYNGFRFSRGPATVYSPISVLKLLDTREFSAHWFETATPTFLVDLIRAGQLDLWVLESITLDENAFGTYEIERLRAEPLLVQSGYLTIKDYHPADATFTLGYPNYEVRQAFLRALSETYTNVGHGLSWSTVVRLQRAVEGGDVDGFLELLRTFFAGIPYDLHADNEKHYQTIFYLVFALLGLRIKAEEITSAGRIDAVIETAETVYIFEFKLRGKAATALAQIKQREYFLKYRACGKKIVLVGAAFDKKTRNIGRWVREEIAVKANGAASTLPTAKAAVEREGLLHDQTH